jgi:hypothetical protein
MMMELISAQTNFRGVDTVAVVLSKCEKMTYVPFGTVAVVLLKCEKVAYV